MTDFEDWAKRNSLYDVYTAECQRKSVSNYDDIVKKIKTLSSDEKINLLQVLSQCIKDDSAGSSFDSEKKSYYTSSSSRTDSASDKFWI